jgi:hypothetical protein
MLGVKGKFLTKPKISPCGNIGANARPNWREHRAQEMPR